ncbi:hypothetical protein [Metabacillus litoralis]|uniref:hypothetical protein n=1 Tax=Metabacillus litoralis TaxID=152268 RepID=UPI001CFD86C2|nr:hypothetical protein [Metabacillus litoralis]
MRKNIKNEKMPDFKQLDDRIIAEPSTSPSLVIKTNLDTENVSEENPYINNNNSSNDLKSFFKD